MLSVIFCVWWWCDMICHNTIFCNFYWRFLSMFSFWKPCSKCLYLRVFLEHLSWNWQTQLRYWWGLPDSVFMLPSNMVKLFFTTDKFLLNNWGNTMSKIIFLALTNKAYERFKDVLGRASLSNKAVCRTVQNKWEH